MKKYVLLLIFLSPVVAELFSGSSPFMKFFSPPMFLVFLGFYGLGCLLIREIAAHKGLNYASVLLLGAAFGVLEEGIILKSWFDPTWMGAQITSQVLRVYGISVLQPFANVVYHAVVSIAAPIVLVNSVTSKEAWLTKEKMIPVFVIFVISAVVLLFTFNYDYKVKGWQYLVGIVLFVGFFALGLKGIKISPGTHVHSPGMLWVLSALFVVFLFIVFYTLSNAGFPWFIILGLALLLYCVYGRAFSRIAWKLNHYFAAGAGIITGLVPIAAIGARTDPGKVGNFIAAFIFMVLLIIIYRNRSKA